MIKEMIGNHHGVQLFEEARKQYGPSTTNQSALPQDDPTIRSSELLYACRLN
jgi:hypothetical protein